MGTFVFPLPLQLSSLLLAPLHYWLQWLTRWGRERMTAISQTTFSDAFSWMKIFEFRLKFHWSLFPRVQLTIVQHWFRQWLGADQATSHYLNQWWLDYRRIYASLGLNELTIVMVHNRALAYGDFAWLVGASTRWVWCLANRPISQILECTCSISHNAPFRTEMHISVLIGSLWDMEQVHSGFVN